MADVMKGKVPDCLRLRGVRLNCRIGVSAGEKKRPRRLQADIVLCGDFSRAARTDSLGDAVDYAALVRRLDMTARRRAWNLLEALAEALAEECLCDRRVKAVRVVLEKPLPCRGLGAAAVEIQRVRME